MRFFFCRGALIDIGRRPPTRTSLHDGAGGGDLTQWRPCCPWRGSARGKPFAGRDATNEGQSQLAFAPCNARDAVRLGFISGQHWESLPKPVTRAAIHAPEGQGEKHRESSGGPIGQRADADGVDMFPASLFRHHGAVTQTAMKPAGKQERTEPGDHKNDEAGKTADADSAVSGYRKCNGKPKKAGERHARQSQ